MRRERRQPTRAEWRAITSGESGAVVRRYPKPVLEGSRRREGSPFFEESFTNLREDTGHTQSDEGER